MRNISKNANLSMQTVSNRAGVTSKAGLAAGLSAAAIRIVNDALQLFGEEVLPKLEAVG